MNKKYKIIKGGTVYTPLQEIKNGIVLVVDKKIVYVGTKNRTKIPSSAEVYNFPNSIISPGFIDLHLHGAGGADVMEGTSSALKKISSKITEFGVTGFLPTIYASDKETILKVIKSIVKYCITPKFWGAKILGINIEGPFINPKMSAAMEEKYVREVQISEVKEWLKIAKEKIKIITLAPELKGSKKLVEYLVQNNIIPAGGHSQATYEETIRCYQKGLNYFTHLFNAARPFHHREPGIIGAALTTDKTYVEIIVDGIHLHPTTIKIIHQLKKAENIILVTDAISALGQNEGCYNFSGKMVILKNGAPRLPDGRLAGSVLKMNEAIRNMVKFVGVDLRSALSMATLNPARLLKIEKEIGQIQEGNYANLVVMDNNFRVKLTMVEGKILFLQKQ